MNDHMIRHFLFIVFLLILMGCQNSTDESVFPENQSENIMYTKTDEDQLSNERIAKHLAAIANQVPNVNQATALIAGPYTVVGVDVDKDLDRTEVGVVKYTVAESLQEDPYGKTAIVIADGDIMQRLRNMREQMNDGRPIQGMIDELASIVGRYMPTMPLPDEPSKDQDPIDEQLSEDEEEKLRELQKEQSSDKNN